MSGYIKVTSDELVSTSAQLTAVSSQIEAESANAMSQVNALVGAGWQGSASESFETAMNEWKSGALQMQEALTTISQLLANAAAQYDQTDSAIGSSFAS